MNKEYLEKLARLVVQGGVNLKEGQDVVINADIQAAPLVREVVKAAYDAGARDCTVRYSDEIVAHEKWIRSSEEVLTDVPAWQAALLNDSAENGAAYIHILSDNPDLMKDVDPAKQAAAHKAMNQAAHIYRSRLDQGKNPWTIAAAASPEWAKKVYPELEEEQAVEQLWSDIFSVSRIDDNDPLENWARHDQSFAERVKKLNEAGFVQLHYKNSAGTDLYVDLPENYIFEGGSSETADGRRNFCNIPTEEIFSAPRRDGVNGKLVSTMPLSHSGKMIKDFWFEFKDGKVVDYDAAEGRDVITELLASDEGASRLGEVALVPWGSPIQKINRIFYNTLFDENASCHFALGKAYAECIPDGQNMSVEELKEKGLNHSIIHVDFMVGSEDLSITGLTADGKEIPVFVNGIFSDQF
ncbi:MAG: aminopeptidase [Erysipelotrichaceae bacterium]|nr:aminopeptidase [Erysipelotrichaceae bacterium]